MNASHAAYAAKAYGKTFVEVADPRELEAGLLLKAAAQLQAVADCWPDKRGDLAAALLYNRRLWLIFIDAVMSEKNRLPAAVRQNIANLGIFVMGEIYSLMTAPKPEHFANLIKINRALAAGLSPRRSAEPGQPAAAPAARSDRAA